MIKDQNYQHNREVGKWGEDCAKKFLLNNGLNVIANNLRTPEGEIDIIAQDGNTIVFVEVKTRTNNFLEYPEESITDSKIEHMLNSAEWYLLENGYSMDDWRIDVIAILGRMNENNPKIEWFQDAA